MASTNQRIKGITIEIDGKADKLQNALKGVNKSIRETQTSLKDVNTLLKLDPGNTELLKQKQTLLKKEISDTKAKLEQEKQALAQLKDADSSPKVQAQIEALEREIVSTEQYLKSATKELKEFGSVGAQKIKAVGENFKDVGGKISQTGQSLMGVSTATGAVLTASAKSAIDWESAFTGVMKTVDETAKTTYSDLEAGIKELSTTTASSKEEIAAVAEAAGQLGVSADNVMQFTEVMVRLGDSTNLSATEAATAIAQMYNITGEGLNTVDKFGATIVELGNNSATTEADIVNMATRIAAAGSQVGMTSQDILGLSAALASTGMEAEAGGSAISTVITKIDKAVALNSDSLATWAETAGMSVEEFKTLWGTDVTSAIEAVITGMANCKDEGGNLNVMLEELGITQLRQSDAMKRLAGDSDFLANSIELANNAWDENSALTEESEKRYETNAAKINQMKEEITNLAIEVGENLLPIIESFMEKISELADKFDGLDENQQKIITGVLLAITVLAPLLVVIGTVVSAVGTIITVVGGAVGFITGTVVPAIGVVSAAMGALNISIFPIIAVIVGIIAAITAIILIIKNWGAITEWFGEKWKEVKDKLSNVWNSVKSKCSETFSNMKNTVQNAMSKVHSETSQKLDRIKQAYSSWGGGVKGIMGAYFQTQKEIWSTGYNTLNTLTGGKLDEIKGKFTGLASSAATWGRDMMQNFINGITEKIAALKAKITEVADAVKNVIGFSEPKEGPLSKTHTFMPDMVDLLAKTLDQSMYRLTPSLNNLSSEIANGIAPTNVNGNTPPLNPSEIYKAIQTGASDANITLTIGNREFSRALRGMGVSFSG